MFNPQMRSAYQNSLTRTELREALQKRGFHSCVEETLNDIETTISLEEDVVLKKA